MRRFTELKKTAKINGNKEIYYRNMLKYINPVLNVGFYRET